MAITVEARTSIIELVVGMFGAAPGASVLSDLVAAYEAGQSIKQIAANLAKTNEFKGIYQTFLTNGEYATKVVNQLLAEASSTAKAEAVTVLTAELNSGMSRSDAFVAAINFVNGTASTNTTFGTSAAAFDNKVAVATYYSVDKALSGSSLAALQNVISGVTSTASTVDTAKSTVDGSVNVGQTFSLTTGIDSLTGLGGNDTFNASFSTAATDPFGGLDVIDGGAGTDTLNVADSDSTAAAFSFNNATIKNVENVVVSTNGNFGGLDISGHSGLTSFTGTAADTAATTLTAAGTTDVTLTLSTTNNSSVTGGKAVSVTKGSTAAGTLGVTGSALTAVSLKGGTGAVTISNNTATTLKSVTLDGVDVNTGITANGLTDVTLKGAVTAARTITITNSTAAHSLTVNAAGTGYNSAGTTEFQTVVTDTVATSATVNTTAKSSLDLVNSTALKSVTLSGSGALKLATTAAAVTSIDGSAATGALTLGTLNAAVVTVKTGSAADSLTVAATTTATVDTGAGNDVVTLGSALAAGSKISLGAGNDTLLKGTGSVATSTSTVIDGGDGDDSVSAHLISAGNAAQFKNFEKINLDSTTGLDLALLTGNTITGLTLSAASTTATYQNVKVANSLSVESVTDNSAFTNTLTFSDASGSSDTYNITFSAVGSATSSNVKASTIAATGIENFSIVSGGTVLSNFIVLGTDSSAKTVTVTGAAKLDLAFAAGFGTAGATTGVTSIDGSAATGALTINTTNAGVTTGSAGLTVKGGSAGDTITLAHKATVDAGAGADTITVSANGGSITTGAGNDSVDVSAAVVGTATPAGAVITTITDLAAGDKIVFANLGTEVFTTTKVNVGTATALIGGTTNALDLAVAAGDSTTNGQITWFQYAGDTYIVEELGANAAVIGTDDIVIKLTGLIDLSTATFDAATNTLTIV